MAFDRIKERVIAYQERCLEIGGDSARGVDWGSQETQHLLFRVIRSMGIRPDSSVLDVGCGLAHFHDFLVERGYRGSYTGVDISPALVREAGKRLPGVDLRVQDILHDPLPARSFDFVVASGIFSGSFETPIPEFEGYIEEMIRAMYSTSRHATVFNMLTSYVDYEVPHLYYANPARYLTFAKSISRYVSLKHDYPAFFFTLGLYRDGDDYSAG